jgi:hypothetical protein
MGVADPGGLGAEVVVVADEHVQLGQGVVADVNPLWSVRQNPGGVGDDEGVTGVGLGAAGIQIGDPAHGQTGQIRHLVPARSGHRDRQRSDRVRLVNHNRIGLCVATRSNTSRSVGSLLGSGLSCSRFPLGSRPTAWCSPLPTSKPRNTP